MLSRQRISREQLPHDDEQEPGGSESRDDPLGARIDRRVEDESNRGGGEDDSIRNDPKLDIDRRQCHENGAEAGGESSLGRRPEDGDARDDERGRHKLDERIEN